MGISECVMCTICGDLRSRDRELRRKKRLKMAIFGLKI